MINLNELNRQKLDQLGISLKADSSANELLRQEKTLEWLESLRTMEQVYDPEAITKMESDEEAKIYPAYTRSKVIPLESKLIQHLIPEKELNWNIKPTAVPSISQKTLDYIVTTLAETMQITPDQLTVDQVESAVKDVTALRADNMKVVMTDQLSEDKYKDIQAEALRSGVRYGTGIIKGALSQPYSSTKITKTFDVVAGITKFTQETKSHFRPSGKCVRIWNFFPDMTATELHQCRFVDTIWGASKKDMRELALRKDFFGDVINEFLTRNPRGNYKLRDWEITQRSTGTHNTDTTPTFLSNQGYSASSSSASQETGNYEVVERDCYIDGHELFEMGITDIEDVNETYFCNVWLLGDKVIKLVTWDKKLYTKLEELYHLFYYDKNETSIFGKGLPKIIRYEQLALAACDRNMLRNAAWVSGPVGEVNIWGLSISQVKDAHILKPGKMYVSEKRGSDANAKTLQIYDIESRVSEFLAMKNDFRAQGDSDSSLPSYLFGDTSANMKDTPLGTSKMQFASMIDFIKSLVGNFDSMHKSYLNSVYKWNMAHNPDENIKGDMQIDTIGSAAAIINEAIVSQWAFLIQSLPDEAKDRIDWDAWLKMYGKYSGLPEYEKIVLSEDAYQQKVQQRQQEQERQLAIQEGLAQAKILKDQEAAKKTAAATEKVIAETPHHVQSKAIDNESKQVDNFSKVVDMQHKKAQMDSMETNDMMKAAELLRADKEENEPVPA